MQFDVVTENQDLEEFLKWQLRLFNAKPIVFIVGPNQGKFAGEVRSVELTKREWVLNGDSVQYTPSCMIKDTLEQADTSTA